MNKFHMFVAIMAFYAFVTFILFPYLFYSRKNTLESAGNGFVAGSVLSVVLWFMIGRSMI